MTYLSYAQGYKGPAYNLTATTDPSILQPVEPETSDAFELSNAGKVSTRGVELDVTAIPMENLRLYTSVAYVRAKIDEYEGGPCNFQQHSFTVFVKNVTDQFYVNGIVPTTPYLIPGGYMQNVPKYAHRTVGLEYHFRWF